MSAKPESTTTETPAAAPKKSRKMLIVILFVAALAIGGGSVFYLQRARAATPSKPEKSKKSRAEKSADEDSDTDTKESKSKTSAKSSKSLTLPDDSDVKQVIELQPFIVNLADNGEARYLRMTVSLGIGDSKAAEKPDPLFTTRVRNAMLAVLTTKTSDDVLTVKGKTALRKELLEAAQAAVDEPEVKAIYITDFIVQL